MYQTTDLGFSHVLHSNQPLYKNYHILIFLSTKNNKNQPIKALELDINIFLQNMQDIYFSYKSHHKRRLTKLEPYFSEQHVIYYAFSKKIAIIRIK
jgi:hypothetical protein